MSEINPVTHQQTQVPPLQTQVPPQAAYARTVGPFGIPAGPPVVLEPIAPWIWITSTAVLLLLTALTIYAVKSWRAQTQLADSVVTVLHQQMTRADDAGILATADPAYRRDVGVRGSNDLFDYVRTRLGSPHAANRISTFASSNTTSGQILTLRYETAFDKGSATETIKLHKDGGVYRLFYYYIDSPLLRQDNQPSNPK